ncbi:izumo sperm-egg fusion protein 1 [Mus caroli]|uniref:Izumo sperm-egg fusion protein 1 n=1 Tax=Mus caroli TaxID=10089 RepID=A0A6P5Q235_MUSCR|nr:izumo sperm-egg fusion protein 1 [Mus caroli]
MGPHFTLLLAALANYLCPGRPCIKCDQLVTAELKTLENTYLRDHLPSLPSDALKNVMRMVNYEVNSFGEVNSAEDSYLGAVDENTLEQAVWSFLKDLKRITDSDLKGELFIKELLWMLQHQKDIYNNLARQFQKEVLCPNKCGVMSQTLIWCHKCEKQLHLCRKSLDCGERHIEVHRSEDLVLDCLLSWHHASKGLTDYSFYRVWENNSETLIAKGKEPYLTKSMVGPEDAGNYRCVLDTINQGHATVIRYDVTVLPPRPSEENQPPNIITQEEQETPDQVTPQIPPGQEPESDLHHPELHHPELYPELTPTVAQNPEKKMKTRLLILLTLGFVVLVASIIISVLHFRKVSAKLKNASDEVKTPVTRSKSELSLSQQMGLKKASQADFNSDYSGDKSEATEN